MIIQESSTDFPFQSQFVDIKGHQMHYIEQGTGDVILFIHGSPTSSYLWRNIIPYLSKQGKCIALDLIGMGKSEKPIIDYSFLDHSSYLEEFIAKMKLENITLVVHDWGAALGFYYAIRNLSNVKSIAFMEPILFPIPSYDDMDGDVREFFENVRNPEIGTKMIIEQNLFIENILPAMMNHTLAKHEHDFYREPYIDKESRRPLLKWPNEVPIAEEPIEVFEVLEKILEAIPIMTIPKLLLHAEPGVMMPEEMVEWSRNNIKNLNIVNIGTGLHFIQEDQPDNIGNAISKWYREEVSK